MNILGIDPGMSGAIAWYDGAELIVWNMPIHPKEAGGNDLDIHKLYRTISQNVPDHCFLEKTTPMPGVSGKASYSMGKSEGALVGILVALFVPYTLVRPAQWKKEMACPADKNLSRQRASQLLPAYAHNWDRKKDDGIAEAALIALYGWQYSNKNAIKLP